MGQVEEKIGFLLEGLRPSIQRLGGGSHDGEDLYGDVCLACLEKGDRYDWSHAKIEGRVICMANNLRITRVRHERLRKHLRLLGGDCEALARDSRTVRETEDVPLSDLLAAVAALPDKYRKVIQEHYFSGKRLVAIAKEMKLPPATIRTRHRRALERLGARSPCQTAVGGRMRLRLAVTDTGAGGV